MICCHGNAASQALMFFLLILLSLSIFRAVRLRVQPVRVGHPNAGAASDPL